MLRDELIMAPQRTTGPSNPELSKGQSYPSYLHASESEDSESLKSESWATYIAEIDAGQV